MPYFAIALAALAVRGAALSWTGIRHGGDTVGYLATCDLMSRDFGAAMTSFIGIEYLGFTLPFCAVLAVAGEGAWVGVQLAGATVAAALVFDIGRRVWSPLTGVLAAVGYAFSFEMLRWDVFLLSDSIFATYVIATTWLLVLMLERPRLRICVALGAAMLILAFTRPGAILLVGGWLVVLGVWAARQGYLRLLSRRARVVLGVVGGAGALALVAGVAPTRVPFYRSLLEQRWRQGTVVSGDTLWEAPFDDTGVGPWIVHVLDLGARRVAVVWVAFLERYSPAHNLLNAVTLLPLLVLGAIGWVRECFVRGRVVAWLIAVPIIAVHAQTVLVYMDWDWRYRNPMLPALLLFGAAVVAPYVQRVIDAAVARRAQSPRPSP